MSDELSSFSLFTVEAVIELEVFSTEDVLPPPGESQPIIAIPIIIVQIILPRLTEGPELELGLELL